MKRVITVRELKQEIAAATLAAMRALDSRPASVVFDHLEEALVKTLSLMDNKVQKKLFMSINFW